MPTENRSSNTEMVSVPEGFMLVERSIWTEQQVEAATACITRLKGVPGMRDCDLAMAAIDAAQCKAPDIALSDLLPTLQPHPDPIAWMVGTAFWWTKEEAERDAAETGLPIVGLGPMTGATPADLQQVEPVALAIPNECPHIIVFDDADRANEHFCGAGARTAALRRYEQISQSWNAHLFVRIARNSRDDRYPSAAVAEPAEVERLREEVEKQRRLKMLVAENLQNALANCSVYRYQLAEQSTLLQVGLTMINRGIVSFDDQIEYRQKLAALSASAEPSAPVEIDERAEFEQACREAAIARGRELDPEALRRRDDGSHVNPLTECGWWGWQARAALERKPA